MPCTTPMIFCLGFKDRALFDMCFEEGLERAPADWRIAEIADPLQFLAERLAVEIGAAMPVFFGEDAAKNAGGNHGRGKARAFFVRPDGNLERRFGLELIIVKRSDDFKPGEDAEHAVELAAGRLRVEMAAGDDRRQVVVPARAAREDVAHAVDCDRAARLLAPLHEKIAPCLSRSVRARRAQPPFAVAPIFAISIRLSQRRFWLI